MIEAARLRECPFCWASRITLEVTDVRVERLQAITEEDARAEGVKPIYYRDVPEGFPLSTEGPEHIVTARAVFAALWDSLNTKRAPWKSNPWVWVVGFRRLPAEGAA